MTMTGGVKGKTKWGDDDEDDLDTEHETPVDVNGIKERVKISTNAKGQKVKTITKIRVKEVKIREPKSVAFRRNLPKFGDAVEGEVNVTLLSRDLINIEHPDDQLADDGNDAGLTNTLGDFMAKLEQRRMERELDYEEVDEVVKDIDGLKVDAENGDKAGGKYVPPGQRGGAVGGPLRGSSGLDSAFANKSSENNDNTLRVSNLTKSITDDDLRELFLSFGRISRISLPRGPDREPRGFAYVSFYEKRDAEFALEKLQGYGYDHLILKLEWAKPPSKDPSEQDSSAKFRSGYGTALAQDTKEKVSFASNLTINK
jgi:translation initiation factor 3 subunit G